MTRRTPAPVAPTGLLDLQRPIVRNFDDGSEVSTWVNIIRAGGSPPVDLIDQLEAAGWQHIAVSKVEKIIDGRTCQPIGYGAISGILGRSKDCELEIELTDSNGRKYQMALCRNEFTLLHGHTTNYRGPERRMLLKMATTSGALGGLLVATR